MIHMTFYLLQDGCDMNDPKTMEHHSIYSILGGGLNHFLFIPIYTPIPGEMIEFDEHIFQMGWFNYQLVNGVITPIRINFTTQGKSIYFGPFIAAKNTHFTIVVVFNSTF